MNLYDNYQVRHEKSKTKIKWLINCLRNQDLMMVQMGYGAMKERKLMLDGVGLSGGEHKKNMLIRRLRDVGYNMQVMGINALVEFLKSERAADDEALAEAERLQKEKDRILKMFMSETVRTCGQVLRQLKIHKAELEERENKLIGRQRGIMKRILSSTTRLMAAALNTLIDYSDKDGKIKNRTIRRIMDVNYRNMAGAWRIFIHWYNICMENKARIDRLKKNVAYRMTDKAHNMVAAAFRKLHKNSEFLAEKKKAIALRIMDVNIRLLGMGYNKLVVSGKAIYNMQRSFAMRLLNSQVSLMGQGMRSLREFNWLCEEDDNKIFAKKEGLVKRFLNTGLRLMGGCLHWMRSYNRFMMEKEEREFNQKKSFIMRLVDKNLRLAGMALNALAQHNTAYNQVAERKERLQKKFINFVINSNYRLMLSGFGVLLDQHKQMKFGNRVDSSLKDMKNGMLNNMAKTRAMNEKRQVGEFLKKLKRWNDVNKLKDHALKKMARSMLCQGEAEKKWGLQGLRIFNLKEKAFRKCHVLYKLMAASDHQLHKQKSLHY